MTPAELREDVVVELEALEAVLAPYRRFRGACSFQDLRLSVFSLSPIPASEGQRNALLL